MVLAVVVVGKVWRVTTACDPGLCVKELDDSFMYEQS